MKNNNDTISAKGGCASGAKQFFVFLGFVKLFNCLIIFWILISPVFAEQIWNFDYDLCGWTAGKDISNLKVSNSVLSGTSASELPLLLSPDLYLDADANDTLEIRLKSSSTRARIFWIGTFDKGFLPQKQIEFGLINQKEFNTYCLNLKSRNPLWQGSISKIIISPASSPSDFEIDYIKFKKGTLITNLLSGWSEFWGPNGRIVMGITINNIPNSTIIGKPITYYIYTILFILSVVLIIKQFGMPKAAGSFIDRWQKLGLKIVALLFFFWIILEINSIYNQINILRRDLPLLSWSLEQKQAYLTQPDFYNFLSFCNKKLPPRSMVKLINNSEYAPYFQSSASYFLYPNLLSENPDFILVYRESLEIDPAKLEMYAKLTDEEYILKCR